jgi:hypothetical protein
VESCERRSSCRFRFNRPLHFRVMRSQEDETSAESLDISTRGVCILTHLPPNVGSIVELRLPMPRMVTSKEEIEWKIIGHVMRVQAMGGDSKQHCVGVKFDCYEIGGKLAALQAAEPVMQGGGRRWPG